MDRSAQGDAGTAFRPVRPWQAPGPAQTHARSRVCFLYVGQGRRDHAVATAVELARRAPEIEVEIVATSLTMLDLAARVAAAHGGAPVRRRLLGPDWLRRLPTADGTPPKLPMLLAGLGELARYDAIVAPERTVKLLRTLGLPAARLVSPPAETGPVRLGMPGPSARAADAVARAVSAKAAANDLGPAVQTLPPGRRTA